MRMMKLHKCTWKADYGIDMHRSNKITSWATAMTTITSTTTTTLMLLINPSIFPLDWQPKRSPKWKSFGTAVVFTHQMPLPANWWHQRTEKVIYMYHVPSGVMRAPSRNSIKACLVIYMYGNRDVPVSGSGWPDIRPFFRIRFRPKRYQVPDISAG